MDTPWLEIFKLLFVTTVAVFLEPVFWGILAIIAYQYWQVKKQQLIMFGVSGFSISRQVKWAMLYGTFGGLLGSLVLTFVGVNLDRMGFLYIWPLAMLLTLINMRFLCFAYAGGIVATISALTGWPDVDVPQVLALVAALHVTESFLIAISGRYGAVPIIVRQGDRLVGAFNLQNFWPLPLVVLSTIAMKSGALPEGVFHTPDWWPLLPLGIEPPAGFEWVYVMMPVVAALGYTDVAISSTPEVRRLRSAVSLAFYSLSLLAMALLAAKFAWLKLPAALLSPLGHEYLVRRDNRLEMSGAPRYVPPAQGAMVLESIDGGIARKMGVRSDDIIVNFAGFSINRGVDLAYAMEWAPPLFELVLLRKGREVRLEGNFPPGERMLGLILVPEGHEPYYVTLGNGRGGLLARWLRNLIRRFRRGN